MKGGRGATTFISGEAVSCEAASSPEMPNIVMLENLSEEIRGCLRHAEECARKACGAPMRFLRTVPTLGGLPEVQTFECRPSRLAVTAEQG
jgi:hypothetical protein